MIKRLKDLIFECKALVIKDLKLRSRYKAKFIFLIIIPITNFLIPFLIFNKIFERMGEQSFGIWSPENYVLFILTGVFIVIIIDLISVYGHNFLQEKYWKTLSGVFMSPVKIYSILLSKLIVELVTFCVPLVLVLIICFMVAGSSLITIISVLIFYTFACVFISSVGLAIGSFKLSIEGEYKVVFFFIKFFLIFSCYKYPKEFFPEELQIFIYINPFFYFWDIIRIILVLGFENVVFNPRYTTHFVVVLVLTIIGPILSVLLFKYVYRKFGISGY